MNLATEANVKSKLRELDVLARSIEQQEGDLEEARAKRNKLIYQIGKSGKYGIKANLARVGRVTDTFVHMCINGRGDPARSVRR